MTPTLSLYYIHLLSFISSFFFASFHFNFFFYFPLFTTEPPLPSSYDSLWLIECDQTSTDERLLRGDRW